MGDNAKVKKVENNTYKAQTSRHANVTNMTLTVCIVQSQ